MTTPDFGKLLAEAISVASQRAELVKQQQAELEAAKRSKADRVAENKSRATGFQHDHLDKLFGETFRACTAQGYRFVGHCIDEEGPDQGTTGNRLTTGQTTEVAATIYYSAERFLLGVLAKTDDYQWPLYHETLEVGVTHFSDEAALAWFQKHIPAAVGMLIEHSAVTKSPPTSFGRGL